MVFRTGAGKRGFTLIELLVVLAILALLLTLAVPRYFRSIDHSKETVLRENLRITREMIGSTSKVLASLAYPEDAPVQTETIDGRKTRTRYGNAVQAAAAMLKKVIEDEDAPVKPTALRVSLSGEGGGSAKVPADHPLYPQIIAFLADQLG